MEISSLDFTSPKCFVAFSATVFCCMLAFFAVRSSRKPKSEESESSGSAGRATDSKRRCNCSCSCDFDVFIVDSSTVQPEEDACANGDSAAHMCEKGPVVAADRQSGASMMEQLVPEITTHALSYLDYPSLCRLSMTNSLMRKAANDDNAWKALYHKDYTLEQDGVRPANGWKAYYAATRAIISVNAEFFNIIRDRSLPAMSRIWLNADYVKCIHASGELFSGYNSVMESWQIAFNWVQQADASVLQIHDIRTRVLTNMAWVTMKTYIDVDTGPYNVTNVFELHNKCWYMVHHHCSVMLID
ncbi:hypothetical protein Nepgr_028570 [Nepenthes gracilis]|uniref:F-box domain-containing protein n=1 Tax=Nepenthes gracilis TaxID=150966 RepID=A0AAD3Y288_NEPGR|nr:hypothetical protein Nepgr_028570 [Nepenthes gracilis]